MQPNITIPQGATSVTVAQDGTVSVTLAGQTAAQQVGSLQLALFNNPGGLNSTGSNLFLATTASGDPIVGTPGGSEGLGPIVQGMLEQSNVSVVDEFVQHDRGATFLRSQLARGQRRRPDAAGHQPAWSLIVVN